MSDYSSSHPGDRAEDHEFELELDPETFVRISKVGGGTVGREYSGYWHYTIVMAGAVSDRGSNLYTGSPHTHEAAAFLIWELGPAFEA